MLGAMLDKKNYAWSGVR